jgi:hypothetical protein
MAQMRGEVDLPPETLRPERKPYITEKDFDRDFAIVFEILGEVNGSHGTVTELSLDLVLIGYGRAQPFE